MNSQSVDIQCQRILSGLRQLEELLAEPTTRETLDLKNNAHTAKNLDLLLRLKHSLGEYTDRGKDLLYVGLMGHFNAGKSSAINSLLNTQRAVDLHPTDKDITLITHKDNRNSVIISTRENLVPIRADVSSEDPFLRNIVLADTPGTGDPLLAKEIARDFLPICDLILYFFSAANPLDTADVPLLREKSAHLRFIPLIFVITRVDEFRKDRRADISEENLDRGRMAAFSAELVSRLNRVLEGVTISTTDLLFVDNEARFHIGELRNLLLSRADPTNFDNRLQIHSHKVLYYRSSAVAIQEFFIKYLGEKIATVAGILTTAQENIERYQQSVEITNNRLTETWQKHLLTIRNLNMAVLGKLSRPWKLPASLHQMAMAGDSINQLRSLIGDQASDHVKALRQKAKRLALRQIETYAQRMKTQIGKADIDEIASLVFEPVSLEIRSGDIEVLPDGILIAKALKQLELTQNQLLSLYDDGLSQARTLRDLLSGQEPLANLEKIHGNAMKALAADLDVYFENVSIYRTGVFSRGAMDAISKLGIGREMDDLAVDEFTDEQREKIKGSFVDEFFPDAKRFVDLYSGKVLDLRNKCTELLDRLDRLASLRPGVPDEVREGAIGKDRAAFGSAVTKETENNANKVVESIVSEIEKQIHSLISDYQAGVKTLRAERVKRVVLLTLFAGAVLLAGYVSYLYLNQGSVPSTPFMTIVFGLVANIIGNVIGYVFAKLSDNFPKRVQSTKSEYTKNLQSTCNSIIDDSLTAYESSSPTTPDLSQLLSSLWTKLLIDDPYEVWAVQGSNFFSELQGIQVDYCTVKEEYLSLVDKMIHQSSAYFENVEDNLNRLREVARPIKERAIEPSFKLLAGTRERLESTKDQIQQIQFS